ncbi:MAG: hypothetical protein ACYDD1_19070 [Caulobacteraceae bacterium]
MKALKLGSVLLAGGLLLGACHPVRGHGHVAIFGHPNYTKILTRLTCPDREGRLMRTDMAADGTACHYTNDRGDDVDLALLALNGAPAAQALASTEKALQAALPADTTAKATAAVNTEDDGDKDDDDDDHGKGDHDHTHIDLPGLHIDADGDKAHVRLPGVVVDADGDKANVHTSVAGFQGASIEANNGGAVIRAGESDLNGADLTYILASDAPGPDGVRAAGYIARGPAVGPLVVATFKSKRSEHDDHGDHDDVSRLVNLNVR